MKAKLSSINRAALLLTVVGAATYANSLSGPFIFDDGDAIRRNPDIRHLWPPWPATESQVQHSADGRPVVSFSLAVNYALGKLDVRGYHAVNIAVHILGAMVLLGVVRRTLMCERLRVRFGHAAGTIGCVCALIWMVHPLQTECVNYIIQRTESIMGLFYLLTLYCACRAGDSDRRLWWQGAAILSCTLGMASKETMVTAPLMVLLYDWAFKPASFGQVLRRRWGLYVGLAATWLVLILLMASGPRSWTVGFSLGVGPVEYAMNQCMVIVDYLRLAVWPHPLILDYGSPESLRIGEVAPYAAFVMATLGATIAALVYRPTIGFPGAWFFVILAPTSTFVPIITEVAAERRMYLPLAGLVVLLVVGVYCLMEQATGHLRDERAAGKSVSARKLEHWTGVALVTALAVALACTSILRNRDYRSITTMWQDVVAKRPLNARGYDNLAHALMALGRYDEAIDHQRTALQLNPNVSNTHRNMGVALWHKKRFQESIAHFKEAQRLRAPRTGRRNSDVDLLLGIGSSQMQADKPEEALQAFDAAVQLDPEHHGALYNLGIAYAVLQRNEEASRAFRQATIADPTYVPARFNLGNTLAQLGRFREAAEAYRETLRLEPDHIRARRALSVVLAELERASTP